MAEANTPPAAAPNAAPSPAAEPAKAPEAPAAAAPPAVDPSTAGKALRAARSFDELKAKAKNAGAPAPAKEEPKAPAAPAAAKPDPDAEAVERILREDRRVKEEAKRVAARDAEVKAEAERLKAARERDEAVTKARAEKDVVGVFRALGWTDADIFEGDDALIFKLAEAKAKAPALTDRAALEKVVADKLAEKDAAEKAESERAAKDAEAKAKAERDAALAKVDEAKDNYALAAFKVATAAPEKYRTLAKLGIPMGAVAEYAWETGVQSGWKTVLTEEQALDQMEAHYAKLAREAVAPAATESPVTPAAPAARPHLGVSINPSWQSQTGRPAAPPAATLKDKFEQLRERARQAAQQK